MNGLRLTVIGYSIDGPVQLLCFSHFQTVFFKLTPTLNGSLPVFTYIPFSSGHFYLYINYPDKYADQSGRDDHSFVAIENYCMVNVDSHTFRLGGENDYNMECESRKYCVFSESCVDSWEDCPGACHADAPIKCADGSCVTDIKNCPCPSQLPYACMFVL